MLDGKEIRALRRLQREQQTGSQFVFTSERGTPFSTAGFRKMLARLGETAKMGFPIHPHMLRHATGFKLANDGADTGNTGLSWAQIHRQHGPLFSSLSRTIQGVPLEGLRQPDPTPDPLNGVFFRLPRYLRS